MQKSSDTKKLSSSGQKAQYNKRRLAAKQAWITIRAKKANRLEMSKVEESKSFDFEFTKKIGDIRPDWLEKGLEQNMTTMNIQVCGCVSRRLLSNQIQSAKNVGDFHNGNRTLFSVFLMQPSCCCADSKSLGEFKTVNARTAAENAVRGKGVVLNKQNEYHAQVRTKSGIVRVSYFFDEDQIENTFVVLAGSFTPEDANNIVDGEFAGTAKAKDAAHKAWKTMKERESKMTAAELKALRRKRSQAAKKAWKTIRAKAA